MNFSKNISSVSNFLEAAEISLNYYTNEDEKSKSKVLEKLNQDQIIFFKKKIEIEDKILRNKKKHNKIKHCMMNKKLCHFKDTKSFLHY